MPISLAVSAKLLFSAVYTTPVWHNVRMGEREREGGGDKYGEKETGDRMQMQDPSRLQICK